MIIIIFIVNIVSPKGVVQTDPMSINAFHGDNVTFTCLTDAGPSNIYQWLVNATDLVCTPLNCSNGIFSFNVADEGKKLHITIQNFKRMMLFFCRPA